MVPYSYCLTLLVSVILYKATASQNLALGKPTASSTFWDKDASFAVDGNSASGWGEGTCFQTNANDWNPWWQVDLENYFDIASITVTARSDSCCDTRLHDFAVEVYMNNPTSVPPPIPKICLYHLGDVAPGTSVTLSCDSVHPGRFVVLRGNGTRNSDDRFTICEIEIFGAPAPDPLLSSINLALRKPTASSTFWDKDASFAVDGNSASGWSQGTCFQTNANDWNPWWQVDLENYFDVVSIIVTARSDSCCDTRLHDFAVEVYTRDPSSQPPLIPKICLYHLGNVAPGIPVTVNCNYVHPGRFVVLRGNATRNIDDRLTICEIEIYGPRVPDPLSLCTSYASTNVALGKPTASSTFWDKDASFAVDGNSASGWGEGTCFQTNANDWNPWWQVDLENYYVIESIIVTARSDSCCNNRLHDFSVEIYASDPTSGPPLTPKICLYHAGDVAPGSSVTLKCDSLHHGRFVVLRGNATRNNDDRFTICEIEILGSPVPDPSNLCIKFDKMAGTRRSATSIATPSGANTMDRCARECWRNPQCESFNFNDGGSPVCEIILEGPLDYTTDAGWIHFHGIPCQ